jgi:hypothetical protein
MPVMPATPKSRSSGAGRARRCDLRRAALVEQPAAGRGEVLDTCSPSRRQLFQESAQYIDLRDILRIAARVVAPGGSIVVADEVPATTLLALMQPGPQDGFKLAAVEDVTSRARGSLDYLIEAVFGHRPRILQAAGLHSHRLTALLHSLEQRRLAYRDGRHRYIIARLDRIDDSSQAPMGVAQQRLA